MAERNWNDWVNDDGLRIRYGTGEAEVTRGGELPYASDTHQVEVVINWDELKAYDDATDPTTVVDWNTRIPGGAHIVSAIFTVTEAFVGANANLDIGLVDANDQDTDALDPLDDDGIDSAIDILVIDAIGDEIDCDGALVNTTLAAQTGGYLISAEADTADFTAGSGRLIIKYFIP